MLRNLKPRQHHQPLRGVADVRGWLPISAGTSVIGLLLNFPLQGYAQKTSSLPPPPNVNFDLKPVPNLAPPQGKAPNSREYIFKAPSSNPSTSPQPAVRRYLVYVNGDSAYLLQQVRQTEPAAIVQTFQGEQVIQVGMFNSETNARQQVEQLKQQGIGAEVAQLEVSRPTSSSPSGYVVVVPANQKTFAPLTEQITRLGIPQATIQPRVAPVSPHLQIGPFGDRQAAEDVSRILRNSGMDARVNFSR